MWAIAKKDFKTLFYSPIGYIMVATFLIMFGVIMYVQTLGERCIDFNVTYNYMAWYGLPAIVSLLAMRSFSEEKNKGTDELLFVYAKNTTLVVIGKILAVGMVVGLSIILSMFDVLVMMRFGNINLGALATTLFGFSLLSIAYISFGILISSLTENQIIAAVISIVFMYLPVFLPYGQGFFSYLSLVDFFAKFPMGIISIKSIIALISFAITCVTLTILEINRKRKID